MTKITRGSVILLSSILGIALLITAVCSFALSPLSRTPADATTETGLSVSGNLYNTDGTLNRSNVMAFLNKLQYGTISTSPTLTSPQIADRAGVSTNSFIFQMGYYVSPSGAMDTSKPLTWQATYLRNGYLTIWLNRGYTKEYFANGTATESNGWKTSSTSYSSSCNDYSHSLLREVTKNIGNALINKFNSMNMIVVSPQEAGATWQATQENAYYSGTNYSTTNGLQSNPNSGSGKDNVNPQGWDWDSTTYNDKFWNPSHVEIYNQPSNSAASRSNGLWGLSFTDINASNSLYDGQTASDGTCWLRSGASTNGREVIPVYNSNSGDTTNDYVLSTSNVGVRPACHINLLTLAEYCVSASITTDSQDKASVSDIQLGSTPTGDLQYEYVYTADTGYSISMVKINNAIVAISEVQPEEFAYAVGCEYKCFRNQNQVYVIVTRPWEQISIEASCDILFTTNTLTTDLQVISSSATSSGSTLDARIILQYNWTPNVRFRLDGGEWNQLVGSNGGGILGTSTYSFSRHEAKFYIIIEIYGLSQTTHSVEVDYYAGGGGGITPSVYNNSGYATFEQYVDDNITRVVVTPASNTYVTALYIDNVRFPVQYYRAEVFGAGMATAIQYIAHETNNTFVVLAQDVYRAMAIEFELSNSLPTLEEPPSSGGTLLTGTVATASAGGEVRMTGFSGDETENSTLHFVALAYSGYEFAGWQVDGEILEGYSAIADIPYSLVDGKIVTAVFEPKDADSSTNSSLNDPTHGADIL